MTPNEQLEQLIAKLEQLSLQQQKMGTEIIRLREQINALKASIQRGDKSDFAEHKSMLSEEIPEVNINFESLEKRIVPPPLPKTPNSEEVATPQKEALQPTKSKKPFDLEGFIGGNLINKIGILILIIGLGLFAKYAIDNGFFPPIVRLVVSFLSGLALVIVGYRLKPKYKTYSAVLFSGGMAVLYFSAYGGFTFYDPALLPRNVAFILMIVFTIVTVSAALLYNLQIIALLGMVGAYAVPLLLSDDSGNYIFFLAYIAIINTGILLVSLRKFWRLTLYITILLSWLIFAFWILVEYDASVQSVSGWMFNLIFFALFYAALVAYNLRNKQQFSLDNILQIFLNAYVFYGLGMVLLENSNQSNLQGGFTLLNGLVHLGLAYVLYRPPADRKIFYALTGLFWIFLTIAIGVEFETSNRALLWLGEAVVLFWIGRRKETTSFEIGSYFVLILGGSILMDYWIDSYYDGLVHLSPLMNSYFASSCLALLGLGVMVWISQRWEGKPEIRDLSNTIVGASFISVLYIIFFNEIYHQADIAYINSYVNGRYQEDLLRFQHLWLLYYSLIFVLGLQLVNRVWLHRKSITWVSLVFAILLIAIYLLFGLYELNSLRTAYLDPSQSPDFTESSMWIWIRYLGYLLLGALVYQMYQMLHSLELWKRFGEWMILFTHFLVLVFLSNELSTLLTLVMEVETDSLIHRVGYSAMWALYALVLIFLGFRNKSKLLRVAGIALFGLTLVKIFLIDLVDISTESRIFLFVGVGVLLLVTSYLYQKYADVLLGEEKEE